jgi:HEAT repeat protein
MTTIGRTLVLVALGAGLLATNAASAEEKRVFEGRAKMYRNLDPKSLEGTTPSKTLLAELRHENIAPMKIWKLLEHGEKVECLSCIPYVKKLLFSAEAKNREIGAWWLRRRVFGVFGPGQAYSEVLKALQDSSESENRRAYAADAVGEFLNPAGVKYVARAAVEDESPLVRASAVNALRRLNHEGPNFELGQALSDDDAGVKLAALKAAGAINVFSSVERVVALLGDESPLVRKRAAETVGAMRVGDAVVGLVSLVRSDEESDDVRAAAIWALGQIGDSEVRADVEALAKHPSPIVRSAVAIALRRL